MKLLALGWEKDRFADKNGADSGKVNRLLLLCLFTFRVLRAWRERERAEATTAKFGQGGDVRERDKSGREGRTGDRREIQRRESQTAAHPVYYQVDRMCVTACKSLFGWTTTSKQGLRDFVSLHICIFLSQIVRRKIVISFMTTICRSWNICSPISVFSLMRSSDRYRRARMIR